MAFRRSLRPLEARRDLERRERFTLRVSGPVREQVALAEVAVGGGAIGRTGRERLLELAHRNGGVARSHRHPTESVWPDESNGSTSTIRS